MLDHLKKVAAGSYANWTGGSRELKTYELLGKAVKALPGTIRSTPDQDDAWFTWLVGHRKQFFDVGANVGFTALVAALQGVERMLIDPNPTALSRAAANLIYNNLAGRCGFVTAFVSDVPGETLPFYTVGAGAAGSMYRGHAKTASASGSVMQVPTTTIDRLVEEQGWTPDFVKIDVEGAEARVLSGTTKLASQGNTWFMVEMHSPPELPMAQNARLVLNWCRENKYTPWYMKEAVEMDRPEMIVHRGKCHLLLLPEGTGYPEELGAIPQGSPLPEG